MVNATQQIVSPNLEESLHDRRMAVLAMATIIIATNSIAIALLLIRRRLWQPMDLHFLCLFCTTTFVATFQVSYSISRWRGVRGNIYLKRAWMGMESYFAIQVFLIAVVRVTAVVRPLKFYFHATKRLTIIMLVTAGFIDIILETFFLNLYKYCQFKYHQEREIAYACEGITLLLLYSYLIYFIKYRQEKRSQRNHNNRTTFYCISIATVFIISYLPYVIDATWNDKRLVLYFGTFLPMLCLCIDSVLYTVKWILDAKADNRNSWILASTRRYSEESRRSSSQTASLPSGTQETNFAIGIRRSSNIYVLNV